MNVRTGLCAVLALFILAGSALGNPSTNPMGLRDCLSTGLVKNPNLKRLEARARQAEARVGEVLAGRDFKFGLQGSYNATTPEIDFTIPGGPPGTPPQQGVIIPASSYAASALLSKLLTSFGQLESSGLLASVQADQERLNFFIARRDFVQATISGYLQILRSRALERLAKDTVKSWEEHLRQSNALLSNGVVARYDVLRAEVEVSKSRDSVTTADKAVDLAIISLKNLLGMKGEESFEILGDDAEEVLDHESLKKIPLDEARRAALAKRSEMTLADCLVRQGETALRIARGTTNPNLNFFTTYTSKTATFMSRTWQWQTGVALNFPLFTGGDRPARIRQAEEIIRQAAFAKEDTALRIGLEVESAWLSFKEAVQRRETALIQLAQAKEGLRLAELRYREHLSSSVELVDAQTACTSAQVNLENSRYNELEAALNLEKALGYFENGEVHNAK